MKKMLWVLFAMLLFSCNNDSDCYECTTTFEIIVNDSEKIESYTVSAKREMCNSTEAEIRQYELDNSDTTVYYNGNMRIDTLMVTKCIL
ncbi:MAG: hypothetical protein RBS38_07770 [Bacteroidales bacterium]|jgi:hypothetical protein|nr:hypothetical protein [Bacteroidales bacterium]